MSVFCGISPVRCPRLTFAQELKQLSTGVLRRGGGVSGDVRARLLVGEGREGNRLDVHLVSMRRLGVLSGIWSSIAGRPRSGRWVVVSWERGKSTETGVAFVRGGARLQQQNRDGFTPGVSSPGGGPTGSSKLQPQLSSSRASSMMGDARESASYWQARARCCVPV